MRDMISEGELSNLLAYIANNRGAFMQEMEDKWYEKYIITNLPKMEQIKFDNRKHEFIFLIIAQFTSKPHVHSIIRAFALEYDSENFKYIKDDAKKLSTKIENENDYNLFSLKESDGITIEDLNLWHNITIDLLTSNPQDPFIEHLFTIGNKKLINHMVLQRKLNTVHIKKTPNKQTSNYLADEPLIATMLWTDKSIGAELKKSLENFNKTINRDDFNKNMRIDWEYVAFWFLEIINKKPESRLKKQKVIINTFIKYLDLFPEAQKEFTGILYKFEIKIRKNNLLQSSEIKSFLPKEWLQDQDKKIELLSQEETTISQEETTKNKKKKKKKKKKTTTTVNEIELKPTGVQPHPTQNKTEPTQNKTEPTQNKTEPGVKETKEPVIVDQNYFMKMITEISKQSHDKALTACNTFYKLHALLDIDNKNTRISNNLKKLTSEIQKLNKTNKTEIKIEIENLKNFSLPKIDISKKNSIRNQAIMALIQYMGNLSKKSTIKKKSKDFLEAAVNNLTANLDGTANFSQLQATVGVPTESETFMVGSYVTSIVEKLINGDKTIKPNDMDLITKLSPKQDYKIEQKDQFDVFRESTEGNFFISFRLEDKPVDWTIYQHDQYHEQYTDSLKNFMIDLKTGQIKGQISAFLLLMRNERRFNRKLLNQEIQNINSSLIKKKNEGSGKFKISYLPYIIREYAKGLKYNIIDISITDYLKSHKIVANIAVSLFLTKYVYNPNSPLFAYFTKNLLEFLPYIHPDDIPQKGTDSTKPIIETTKFLKKIYINITSVPGKNKLPAIFVAVYFTLKKQKFTLELSKQLKFPRNINVDINQLLTNKRNIQDYFDGAQQDSEVHGLCA